MIIDKQDLLCMCIVINTFGVNLANLYLNKSTENVLFLICICSIVCLKIIEKLSWPVCVAPVKKRFAFDQ
jgi:hypothetical protein